MFLKILSVLQNDQLVGERFCLKCIFLGPLTDSESGGCKWGPGICMFKGILRTPDALGLWKALWQEVTQRTLSLFSVSPLK